MKPSMKRRPHRGFALVSAIFLLVVLASLGAFAVSISNSLHIGSALDLQGVRAYQAARTGLEWGAYQVVVTNVGAACPAPTNLTMPAGATTLSGITVTVLCAQDGAVGNGVFRITATACNQPAGGSCPNTVNPTELYVERRAEMFLQ